MIPIDGAEQVTSHCPNHVVDLLYDATWRDQAMMKWYVLVWQKYGFSDLKLWLRNKNHHGGWKSSRTQRWSREDLIEEPAIKLSAVAPGVKLYRHIETYIAVHGMVKHEKIYLMGCIFFKGLITWTLFVKQTGATSNEYRTGLRLFNSFNFTVC